MQSPSTSKVPECGQSHKEKSHVDVFQVYPNMCLSVRNMVVGCTLASPFGSYILRARASQLSALQRAMNVRRPRWYTPFRASAQSHLAIRIVSENGTNDLGDYKDRPTDSTTRRKKITRINKHSLFFCGYMLMLNSIFSVPATESTSVNNPVISGNVSIIDRL